MVRSSGSKTSDSEKKPLITYWAKEKMHCSVCNKEFPQEMMFKGGGRMIAGPLTDELHRVFEPSKRFGKVFPVLYEIGCCPHCYTALFWKDFTEIKDQSTFSRLESHKIKRFDTVNQIFPYFNLENNRSLYDGAAMYYMALLCYEDVDIAYAPTFKRAEISLRLAWLCKELEIACPNHNFDYISQVFYRKALFFYEQTLINETSRIESIESVSNFGPDVDKNYGYDGVIYLTGLLEYKYGQHENVELRLKKLETAKKAIARIFGLGRASKEKPGPLLEVAKNLYDCIAKELSSNNLFDVDDD